MSAPPGSGKEPDKLQGKPAAIQETDTDELKRFREKWKRELQAPAPPSSSLASLTTASTTSLLAGSQQPTPSLYSPAALYPRSHLGDNALISHFLALLEEEEAFVDQEGHTQHPPSHPPVSILPAELQLSIFAFLDVKSLEHCSIVCRFWYILARDEGLPQFQLLCLHTWAGITTKIFESYQCDWRTMYLHRPRLRDDGIYISRNYYLRPGQTEGSYYQPVHEVVYYRYLRFFPHGTVIYALSSDAPKQVLNWFKPNVTTSSHPAHRAVHSGTHILEENVVQVWVKISATHTTCLDLKVESSRVGRNDRLTLMEYKCVHDDDDVEKLDVAIKKFHFVKLPKQYLQDLQISLEVPSI